MAPGPSRQPKGSQEAGRACPSEGCCARYFCAKAILLGGHYCSPWVARVLLFKERELLTRSATMPSKQLLFRSEAREKVLKGASALADALRVTLGPKSKSVLVEKKWGKPIVCNDGVTIAKEISLKIAILSGHLPAPLPDSARVPQFIDGNGNEAKGIRGN